ncbi:MAG TPA: triose-phosphate isomerase [Anaerohalosphaeraceae bacterium]|nr:triose-phosphate isomerase [Anaerohalosphaeraceae bacterium]
MRTLFLAGNWKMNTNSATSVNLAAGLVRELAPIQNVRIAVCPPFIYLQSVAAALSASQIELGAQDVYYEGNGAFTGEISCEMLKDCGCTYVIIGHSERRHILGESDRLINLKIKAAVTAGLKPIFCVGELLEERDNGKTFDVVEQQIRKGLEGLSAEQVKTITIAYEPVWAIGTGRNATPQQAQEVHERIRRQLKETYGAELAEKMTIQYGGSAKPANTAELLAQPDVDGLLVGGASLKVEDFAAMVKTAAALKK